MMSGCSLSAAILLLQVVCSRCQMDLFNETLIVQPLLPGQVMTSFSFDIVSTPMGEGHSHLMPRQFGELVELYGVAELHLTLAGGHWRHHQWGYLSHAAPAGAHLWVWFQPHVPNVDESWKGLVNALAGMFCASLNFMDASTMSSPRMSFRPAGVILERDSVNQSLLRVASLPREAVCTENLTPLEKLLPCGAKAGLAMLLNPMQLFGSEYHSIGISFRPVCMSDVRCAAVQHELTLSVTAVFDPLRTSDRQDWSLRSLFGGGLFSACALTTRSQLIIDVRLNQSRPFSLQPPPTSTAADQKHVMYDVRQLTARSPVNVRATYTSRHTYSSITAAHVPLTATQYQTGSGHSSVGIAVEMNNAESAPLTVLLLLVIPWYIRPYLHTLTLYTCNNHTSLQPVDLQYVPGLDRQRPYTVELLVEVPPGDGVRVSVQAQRAFLKWHEYPPDANHGFYIPAATVSALLSPHNCTLQHRHRRCSVDDRVFVRLYTENLLVSLPTPDFSMPYNVICLVCTAVALAFGPLHNITTKQLSLEPVQSRSLSARLKSLVARFYRPTSLKEKVDLVPSDDVAGEPVLQTDVVEGDG